MVGLLPLCIESLSCFLTPGAGTLSSLKNIKKDVTEMRKGHECGIGFANWSDFKVGDQLQCYEETSEKRTL